MAGRTYLFEKQEMGGNNEGCGDSEVAQQGNTVLASLVRPLTPLWEADNGKLWGGCRNVVTAFTLMENLKPNSSL
jgi:hypothetical protein